MKLRVAFVIVLALAFGACTSAQGASVTPITGSPMGRACESIRRLLAHERGPAYALRTGRAAVAEMVDPERTIARAVLNGLAGGERVPEFDRAVARIAVDCHFAGPNTLPI